MRARALTSTDCPSRPAIAARLNQLYGGASSRFSALQTRGGVLFALKNQPPKAQAFLVTLASPDEPDSARVVVDPNALDPSGATTIDFYEPSLDGKLVAVSLSKGGTEDGTVSVFEVATGNRVPGEVPRVNGATAGGSLAWNADGSGFWYTRYPHEGERPPADLEFFQQVYFHRLGTASAQDEYAVGKQFPRIAEIALESSRDGKYVLARVANGDGGDFCTICSCPTDIGTRSRVLPIALRRRLSAAMARCTCCRARTRPWARSSRSRRLRSRCPKRKRC